MSVVFGFIIAIFYFNNYIDEQENIQLKGMLQYKSKFNDVFKSIINDTLTTKSDLIGLLNEANIMHEVKENRIITIKAYVFNFNNDTLVLIKDY